jgi:hypothetical protein
MSEAYNDIVFLDAKAAFLKGWHNKNSVQIPMTDLSGNKK